MREIVVAVDGSEGSLFPALQVGHELHEQASVPLRLLSVVDDWGKEERRRREIREMLPAGQAGNPMIGGGDIDVAVADDDADYLARCAREQPESLLCLATRGRGAVGSAILGSVAAAVVRDAQRPILLAGPELPAEWRGPILRVVVPLDGSAAGEAILPDAAAVAEALGVELRLIQVVEPGSAGGGDTSPEADAQAYLEEQAEALQPRLSREVSRELLVDSRPATAITDYCAGRGSLVMMSTLGWTGLARLAMGSVAQAVTREAPFPVAVMCPAEDV